MKWTKLEEKAGLSPGDVVLLRDPYNRVMYGSGGYTVVRVGSQNVLVSCDVRWAPNGPWHHQEHRVPIYHVAAVALPERIAS
jgi:hypothetical protein